MARKKAEKPIDKLIAEFPLKVSRQRAQAAKESHAADVAAKSEEWVVLRGMAGPTLKYNGRVYERGETIELVGGRLDNRLISDDHICTRQKYDSGRRERAMMKHQRDHVAPAMANYGANQRAERDAVAKFEALQQQLAAAASEVENTVSQRRAAEDALRVVLTALPEDTTAG